MFILDLIDIKFVDFFVRCVLFCGFGCKIFSFNYDVGLCFIYNICYILNKIVIKMGW